MSFCPIRFASFRSAAQAPRALRAEAAATAFLRPGEPALAQPTVEPNWRRRGGRPDRARAYRHSQTEAGLVEAVLTPRICRDTMADAACGFRAEVTVADARSRRTFVGCAFLGDATLLP